MQLCRVGKRGPGLSWGHGDGSVFAHAVRPHVCHAIAPSDHAGIGGSSPSQNGGASAVFAHPTGSRDARAAWGRLFAAVILAALAAPQCRAAEAVAVTVENASTPTLCAETDNVYLKLASSMVRRFSVEAVHPAYAGT